MDSVNSFLKEMEIVGETLKEKIINDFEGKPEEVYALESGGL